MVPLATESKQSKYYKSHNILVDRVGLKQLHSDFGNSSLKMDNPEETAWVFDSLVGFLHGPVWNAPLQTFIEEKSLSMRGIIYYIYTTDK